MSRIEDEDGALGALESGWLHGELETQAYRHQVAVDSGDHVVVGVNRFTVDSASSAASALTANLQTEKEQVQRLDEVKRTRSAERVRSSLEQLDKVADAGENTIPALLEAVRAVRDRRRDL